MELPKDFVSSMLSMGIIAHEEQESLWQIARRCAKVGVTAGVGAGLYGLKAGTVVVPGVGTVSGALAGFLGGFAAVGGSCVMLNKAYSSQLRQLAESYKNNN